MTSKKKILQVTAEIEGLERWIIDIFETVEGVADTAQDLVIKLNRQTQKIISKRQA